MIYYKLVSLSTNDVVLFAVWLMVFDEPYTCLDVKLSVFVAICDFSCLLRMQ